MFRPSLLRVAWLALLLGAGASISRAAETPQVATQLQPAHPLEYIDTSFEMRRRFGIGLPRTGR